MPLTGFDPLDNFKERGQDVAALRYLTELLNGCRPKVSLDDIEAKIEAIGKIETDITIDGDKWDKTLYEELREMILQHQRAETFLNHLWGTYELKGSLLRSLDRIQEVSTDLEHYRSIGKKD